MSCFWEGPFEKAAKRGSRLWAFCFPSLKDLCQDKEAQTLAVFLLVSALTQIQNSVPSQKHTHTAAGQDPAPVGAFIPFFLKVCLFIRFYRGPENAGVSFPFPPPKKKRRNTNKNKKGTPQKQTCDIPIEIHPSDSVDPQYGPPSFAPPRLGADALPRATLCRSSAPVTRSAPPVG